MKYISLLAFVSILIPAAKADEWDKRTVVKFNQPVEVPGVQNHGHGIILPAGTYVMRLADTIGDRDVVQVFNKKETKVYTTVLTIPEYRAEPTSKTVIHFEERSADAPEAIKDWYYPGDLRGEEFLYSKTIAAHPAQMAMQSPLAEAKPAPQPAPASAPAAAPVAEQAPAPQPVEVAQATPAAPAADQNPPEKPAKKLPKTASDVPLIALAGMLTMASGLALRRA